MPPSLAEKVLHSLRRQARLGAGERVAVAVSGGADSVALLRALLELRGELGMVLSVAHFNHRIRGEESQGDADFTAALAREHGLVFHLGEGDVPAHAAAHRLSVETAARALRREFFAGLVAAGTVDRVATAHTMDDQAETVLMKFLRGAGTRGLAGIHPEVRGEAACRPLLMVRRHEVLDYLRALGQPWREDASNADLRHTRNKVRHHLLPLLAADYNPNLVQVLSETAELARGEEDYWNALVERLLPGVVLPGTPTRSGRASQGSAFAVDVLAFARHPLAVQRRLLVKALRQRSVALDFHHVAGLLEMLAADRSGKRMELPGGWVAQRSARELRFQPEAPQPAAGYRYLLSVPGEVRVAELGATIVARWAEEAPAYNRAHSPGELILRNWQPGDRYWAIHRQSAKKVKELLQELKAPAEERAGWPVAEAGGVLLWVRGLPEPEPSQWPGGRRIIITETGAGPVRAEETGT